MPADEQAAAVDKAAALATELATALPLATAALNTKRSQLAEATTAIEALQQGLDKHEREVGAREAAVSQREAALTEREAQLKRQQQALEQREQALKDAERAAVDAAISHASAPPAPSNTLSMGGKHMSERLEMQVLARATAIALVKHGIQQTKAERAASRAVAPEIS